MSLVSCIVVIEFVFIVANYVVEGHEKVTGKDF